jgi:hypothetical protein
MTHCVYCKAEFLSGEPMHSVTVHENGVTRIELYCIECIDLISEASWNDEEWGPYPSRLQHRRGVAGHS